MNQSRPDNPLIKENTYFTGPSLLVAGVQEGHHDFCASGERDIGPSHGKVLMVTEVNTVYQTSTLKKQFNDKKDGLHIQDGVARVFNWDDCQVVRCRRPSPSDMGGLALPIKIAKNHERGTSASNFMNSIILGGTRKLTWLREMVWIVNWS